MNSNELKILASLGMVIPILALLGAWYQYDLWSGLRSFLIWLGILTILYQTIRYENKKALERNNSDRIN